MTALASLPSVDELAGVPLDHHTVCLESGDYHLVECGSGAPLLLIHGWSGSWENFVRWLPQLSRSFRLLIPDLPGCNGAPVLPGAHTMAGYAEFVLELLASRGLTTAHVGGLCFGANIGMALAEHHPDAVRTLLLHTPLFHPRVTKAFFKAQIRFLASSPAFPLVSRLRFNDKLMSLYRRTLIEGDDVEWFDNAVNQKNMRVADPRAARELARDVGRSDFVEFLRSWRRPTFVIVATKDAFLRFPEFLWIRELNPRCRVSIIEEGGHGWTQEFIRRQEHSLEEFVRFAGADGERSA